MESLSPYARFVVEQLEVEDQETFKSCLESDNGWSSFEAQLHEKIYSNSQLRFRFGNDSQNIPPKRAIFEAAFKKAHEEIIDEIEQKFGISSYPQWKQFIWIDIPRGIHDYLTDKFVAIGIKLALCFEAGYLLGFAAEQVGRAIYRFTAVNIAPYIINNVPVEIVHLFNTIVKCQYIAFQLFIHITFIVALLQLANALYPDNPHLSRIIRFIDETFCFETVVAYLFPFWRFMNDISKDIGIFINSLNFNAVGLFFFQIAEKNNRERVELGKQQAYQLWMEQSLVESRRRIEEIA